MTAVAYTRQFQTGNSQAVRIPANLAFPPKTELRIQRKGTKIIIEPKEATLEKLPSVLAEWGKHHTGKRPEFEPEERNWS